MNNPISLSTLREELGISVVVEDNVVSNHDTDDTTNSIVPAPFTKLCLKNVSEKINTFNCVNDDSDTDERAIKLLKFARDSFLRLSGRKKWDSSTHQPEPTPIQLQTWPLFVLSKSKETVAPPPPVLDIIGISATGSGKTLAFGLPMIHSCTVGEEEKNHHSCKKSYVHGLVLVPTRELSIQVSKALKSLCKIANKHLKKIKGKGSLSSSSEEEIKIMKTIQPLAIYGGVDRTEQIRSLMVESRIFVLATTPGRLLDILSESKAVDKVVVTTNGASHMENMIDKKRKEKRIRKEENDNSLTTSIIRPLFQHVQQVVVDEADRMAANKEMSIQLDSILNILRQVNVRDEKNCENDVLSLDKKKKNPFQMCLFSATLPQSELTKCREWTQTPRVIIKVDTCVVGEDLKHNHQTQDKCDEIKQVQNNLLEGTVATKNEKDCHPMTQQKEEINVVTSISNKRKGMIDYSMIPKHVKQTLHVCSIHKKPKKLVHTMNNIRNNEKTDQRRSLGLCIVFFGKIKTLEYMSQLLVKNGFNVTCLHSQIKQTLREKSLSDFRCGKTPTLLTTDIASRGIHINNVEYVINYDFPSSLEQYVHRCGRAGRNSMASSLTTVKKSVTVYTFFHRNLSPMAKDVVQLLQSCDAWVDPNLLDLAKESSNKKIKKKHEVICKKEDKKKDDGSKKESAIALNADSEHQNSDYWVCDNEQFSSLVGNKIVLKRASYVSDADTEDESDSP